MKNLTLLFFIGLTVNSLTAYTVCGAEPEFARLIEEFKEHPRGPFDKVKWYCNDNTVQPARTGCGGHQGGIQHGELSETSEKLREAGFTIGNLYSELGSIDVLGSAGGATNRATSAGWDSLSWITLERFLMARDNGWIYRQARFVRGLMQAEDEQLGAQKLFRNLLSQHTISASRFLLIREAYRFSPLIFSEDTITYVRAESSRIADLYPQFALLKTKLHNLPEPGDVTALLEFARKAPQKYRERIERIAVALRVSFDPADKAFSLREKLRDLAGQCQFREEIPPLYDRSHGISNIIKFESHFTTLASLRDYFSTIRNPDCRLRALDISIALEDYLVAQLLGSTTRSSRLERKDAVTLLYTLGKALYGMGYISDRQKSALSYATAFLVDSTTSPDTYRQELEYLSLTPSWAQRQLEFEFHVPLQKLPSIEPLSSQFIDDRLRSSLLGIYGKVLTSLLEDLASHTAKRNMFFGQPVFFGLRSLNAGFARGVLVDPLKDKSHDPRTSIYLVPETVANLSPAAGILTLDEGNPVSHVQLLARNLGIPNIVVKRSLVPKLRRHLGEQLIVASTHTGVALIDEYGPRWEKYFQKDAMPTPVKLSPDVSKLDLSVTEPQPLDKISGDDSGVICGPKAANLADLRRMFPGQVADAVVLPFGIFNSMLEKQRVGTRPLKEWMREAYANLDRLSSPAKRRLQLQHILQTIRTTILNWEVSPDIRRAIKQSLDRQFGNADNVGLFVRSDTNIEDLPNFTGAGLNKTVPNVVGLENIIQAVKAVWTSPFTERAYSWRQAMLPDPTHVYPSVLLMKSVPADKSGVMITANVFTGDRNWLTIATNRGIGGVVNNQQSETVLLDRQTGVIRLHSLATAPFFRALSAYGGIEERPTLWYENLLSQQDILELNRLALAVHSRYPGFHKSGERRGVADIEFGFVDGKLTLFQIRPYNEGLWVRDSKLLKTLEASPQETDARVPLPTTITVNLN
jgi:hypothetical protein